MRKILPNLLDCIVSNFRSRAALQFEIIVLRHQLEVLQRTRPARVRLTRLDRTLWLVLYRLWPRCLDAVVIVKPETVIAWHRKGFRAFWTWKSRPQRRGRPPTPTEFRTLIRRMTRENPQWGAPRVHGELLKLGIAISQAAFSKYMVRHPKPPSQTWRTFLRNHVDCLASIDFFVVPTATFRLLFVFIVLHHERRRIAHFGVTAHPTSLWASQQLREAFPWETAPRYLIRDRDGSCLDHVIVLSERHLRRILSSYFEYYHRSRTHLSLEKDCPDPRPAHPPNAGKVIAFPQVSGLHDRYERLAA